MELRSFTENPEYGNDTAHLSTTAGGQQDRPGKGSKAAEVPERVNDTIEAEPRKVGVGDIVTIVLNGKLFKIYIAEKAYGLKGPERELRERLKAKRVNSTSAIHPAVKPGQENKQGLTLAAQLLKNKVGDVITLQTGKSVKIVDIEGLED